MMSNFPQILAEIVAKIQIEPNFTVAHPDYPPLELRADILDRLQRISPQLQSKYLILQVQNYLHDIYFNQSWLDLQTIATAAAQPAQIKNNLSDGVDIDFCQRLHQSNSSRGYLDLGWKVVATAPAGELVVVKDGLHLHINPQRHLRSDSRSAQIGEIVPIYLPHSLVSRDTYIIVGNLGTPANATPALPSVQIYFNFTPDAAVTIAEKLTRQLNTLELPFQFAILHDPALFYRCDGATLWISQADYLTAQTVVAEIYRAHQTAFAADVPLFTKQLAPGLGLAEVPTTLSTFGMQRCEILAMGLVTAFDLDLTAVNDKLDKIYEQFAAVGIDRFQPHLNFAALDCYKIDEFE
ncbi:T3SS effector HopA1 family protein [Chamaesiphon sp. VAR_48_metabat_135_sub]|uniref:T3SS effector HopA1 family protein n=1 Tax=Chamaesiphon sp. VAR_48_metabat_135_sub TaxID=2964699 RepID=UPI00286A06F6|nr:T3SS effector HopA1 family protein [Chamaesiphon sp. VAR_48_metabat_135_sub]